ncbi:MAG: O-antigen ligase family protein [Segetibacter sp.]
MKNLAKFSTLILTLALFFILLIATIYTPLTYGWSASTSNYYFLFIIFYLSALLSIILFFYQKLSLNRIDLVVLSWIIYISATQFFLPDAYLQNEHFYCIIIGGIFYFLCRNILSKKVFIDLFLMAIVLFAVYELGKAYISIIADIKNEKFSRDRIAADFANSNLLACFLAISLPFAYYITRRYFERPFYQNIFFIFYAPAVFVLLIILQSRAALLSIFIASLLIFFKGNNPGISVALRRRVMLILLPVFLIGSVALFFLKYNSVVGRLLMWKITLMDACKSFFFGHGAGSFNYQYPSLQADYFRHNVASNQTIQVADIPQVPFNEFINFFFENGVMGLGLILFLLFLVFKVKMKESALGVVLKASLVALLINSFFSYPLHVPLILLLFFAIIAILANANKEAVYSIKLLARPLYVLMFLCSFLALMYIKKESDSIKLWRDASFIFSEDEDAEKVMHKVYPILKNKGQFLYNYGSLYIEKGKINEGLKLLEKAKQKYNQYDLYLLLGDTYEKTSQLRMSEVNFSYASYMIPNRFVPKYRLVKLYIRENQTAKALQLVNKIILMPVKIPSPQIDFIKQEMILLKDSLKN